MTQGNHWTDPRYAFVVRLLGARTGLMFRTDDCDRVEQGIRAAMQRADLNDLGAYAHLLERDQDVWDDLIVELTVGETYFFREPQQFAFIRDEALPAILQQRGLDHTIRVWSAGCASGEEPYSLAILLEQQGLLQQSSILATDISEAALGKARQAVYPDWSFRGQEASRAKLYLQRPADVNVLNEQIRRHVKFESLNLALDSYPSIITGTRSLDLIMCRNVLIYFDRDTVKSIAQRFYAALADGGWLITASADPQLEQFAPFAAIVRKSGVYYQRARSVPPQTGVRQPAMPRSAANAQPRPDSSRPNADADQDGPQDRTDDDSLADAQRALIEGRFGQAIELTSKRTSEHGACVIRVQALANIDIARAERACASATAQHPLSAHLHYLHALLLLASNRAREAAESARRVIYLDRKLAVAHLLLGSSLRQIGDLAGAHRAFRNAYDLCAARPAEDVVLLSDGETAGNLARAAEFQMQSIQTVSGATR